MSITAYTGADIFDGTQRHKNAALLISDHQIAGIVPANNIPKTAMCHPLSGGTLVSGFVDLQVNGGGGVMFNADPSLETLKTIAQAHARLGTTALLPTLISDTPEKLSAAIDAVEQAILANIASIIGLHLEGPHLSVARKGAHQADMIRPMLDADLDILLKAASRLPHLMVTVAPENTTPKQISVMANAGITVSLGHTNAPYAECLKAADAGATCATHLFNAMSQLTGRDPGMVGVALEQSQMFAGLIADGIHVSPSSIRLAIAAKQGPAAIFLVSDAMATAGSEITEFSLNRRSIYRRDGRLTLKDGTLAGADLELATALRFMVQDVGVCEDTALKMATSGPAKVINTDAGHLIKGRAADFIHLDADLNLKSVWQNGWQISP